MRLLGGATVGLVLASLACERLVGIGETKVWLAPSDGEAASSADGGSPRPSRGDGASGTGGRGVDAPLAPEGVRGEDGGAGDAHASASDANPAMPPPDTAAADGVDPPPYQRPDAASTPADTGPLAPPRCSDPTADVQVDEFTPQNAANCSFGSYRPTATWAAAVDNSIYDGSVACGACIEISNARGKVVAQPVERYPTSPEGGRNKISVNRAALEKLGGGSIAQAKWRWVPCPVSGSIRAALKEANNPYFLEVILLDFTNRLTKLEFRTSRNRTWREARRQSYNYFLHSMPEGLPTELRLTDSYGNQVVSKDNLRWEGTSFISLETQFPPQCSY